MLLYSYMYICFYIHDVCIPKGLIVLDSAQTMTKFGATVAGPSKTLSNRCKMCDYLNGGILLFGMDVRDQKLCLGIGFTFKRHCKCDGGPEICYYVLLGDLLEKGPSPTPQEIAGLTKRSW